LNIVCILSQVERQLSRKGAQGAKKDKIQLSAFLAPFAPLREKY